MTNLKKQGQNILEQTAQVFDLPAHIVAGLSRIEIMGDKGVSFENHDGILEYDDNIIKINTKSGIVQIKGVGLELKSMSQHQISVKGRVFAVEILDAQERLGL